MKREVKTTLVVEGEASYKNAIKNINKEQSLLKSELKNTNAQFELNNDWQGKLTAKTSNLSKQIDLQKKKIEQTKNMLESSNKKHGEGSAISKEYQIELNDAETALSRLEKQLSKTKDELKLKNNELKISQDKLIKTGDAAKSAGDKIANVGKGMEKVGEKLTIGLTLPVAAAGVAAFNLAADYQETLSKLDVAFGSNANEVKAWSETTLNSFGISKTTSGDMAALYGDMATSMGATTGEATEMAKTLVGLSGDMASYKNVKLDVAGTALNSVFTGETESMKKLGIVMTEVNLQEYAYSVGIDKKISQMTQFEKVQLRYNYVLEKSKNAQGDFARTSESSSNQSRLFGESLKELGATFGEELLPIITPFIKEGTKVIKTFADMDESSRMNIIRLAGLAVAIGPVVKVIGGITTTTGKATSAIGKFITELGKKKAAEEVAEVATEGMAKKIGSLPSFINPTTAVIGAAVTAVGLLAYAIDQANKPIEDMFDSIGSVGEDTQKFSDGIDGATSALESFDDSTVWTTENQDKLKKKVDEAQASITTITDLAVKERRSLTEDEYKRLQALIDQLGAFADGQIEAYQQKNRILEAMAKNEKNMTEQRAQEIIKASNDNADEVIAIAESQRIKEYQIADKMRSSAVELRKSGKEQQAKIEEERAKQIETAAESEYAKVVESEQKKTATVISAVQDRYLKQNQTEAETLQKFTEFKNQMETIDREAAEKIKKVRNDDVLDQHSKGSLISEIYSEQAREKKKLTKELSELWDEDTQKVASAAAAMTIEIEMNGGKQSEAAKKVTDGILSAFSILPEKQRQIAKDAMQGMLNGFKDKAPFLYEMAENLGDGFIKGFKKIFDINSPSKVMQDIGENVVGSFADTTKKETPKAESAAAQLATGVVNQMKGIENANLSLSVPSLNSVRSAQNHNQSKVQSQQISTSPNSGWGDITLPVYIDGKLSNTEKITSQELARQQKLRMAAGGVIYA